MRRHPSPRAARLALLFTVVPYLDGTPAQAQNAPAGPPPEKAAAPVPAAEKPSGLREAALKPATAEPAPPPSAEETAPVPTADPAPLDPLPGEAPPDPPPLDRSLFGDGPPAEGPPPGVSENVTINLIMALVKKKILTEDEAMLMVQQAQSDAAAARTAAKAEEKRDIEAEQDSYIVSDIPAPVRRQLHDEIKQEVLAEMRRSGDKEPHYPEMKEALDDAFAGDLRIRYEMINFSDANDNTGSFPNFNAINTGAPFDTAGSVFSPQYNVDEDRERYRLRFRISGEYDLGEGWDTGFRIATGENTSPTTTNQSVGLANQGSGGNFSKYAIWLDRAFMRYTDEFENGTKFTFWGGRFDNPFFSTEIIFDEDVGFDGLAFNVKSNMGDKVKPYVVAGAFPVFNTDLNFSSNQPAKFKSTDKYLFAAQVGADFKLTKELTAKLSAAYYAFDGVEGELSTPYTPINAQDAGDTDNTRPSFAQRGNTYRPLRQIIPDATNNFGTINQWQYYGLATPFRPLTVTGKLDWDHFEPVRITLYGEYIRNTAFDKDALSAFAVNNRGPAATAGGLGAFEGSGTAWITGVKVGHPALDKRHAWQAIFNYRNVGSDAVIDGLADSEFGGGGTNVKGWTLAGSWALSKSTAMTLSWLSSNQIAGPPLKTDYLQLDLKVKF